jgi:hypothetical protein
LLLFESLVSTTILPFASLLSLSVVTLISPPSGTQSLPAPIASRSISALTENLQFFVASPLGSILIVPISELPPPLVDVLPLLPLLPLFLVILPSSNLGQICETDITADIS